MTFRLRNPKHPIGLGPAALPDSLYLMVVYSVFGILIEEQSLVVVFSRITVGSLNDVLNFIQQLVEVIALTTAIGMGVVVSLSKGLMGGITKAIYTIVIRDAGVFTDVNLNDKNKL